MSHISRKPKPPRCGRACPGPHRARSIISSGPLHHSYSSGFLSSSSCREASASSRDVAFASLRPLACDFRRLRFSRSASFSRSCREFLAGWLLRWFLSSVIVNPFGMGGRSRERQPRPADLAAVATYCGSSLGASISPNPTFQQNDRIQGAIRPIRALPATRGRNRNQMARNCSRKGDRGRPTPISIIFEGLADPSRACAYGGLVARIGPLCRGPFGPILVSGACCRSSVVEHSIGNGEVDSSILSGSTSLSLATPMSNQHDCRVSLIVGFGCFSRNGPHCRSQTQQDINRLPA
jgi:hypothetical protein